MTEEGQVHQLRDQQTLLVTPTAVNGTCAHQALTTDTPLGTLVRS